MVRKRSGTDRTSKALVSRTSYWPRRLPKARHRCSNGLAGLVVRGAGVGLIGDIAIGIIGAIIRDWLLPRLGVHLGSGTVSLIINAIRRRDRTSSNHAVGCWWRSFWWRMEGAIWSVAVAGVLTHRPKRTAAVGFCRASAESQHLAAGSIRAMLLVEMGLRYVAGLHAITAAANRLVQQSSHLVDREAEISTLLDERQTSPIIIIIGSLTSGGSRRARQQANLLVVAERAIQSASSIARRPGTRFSSHRGCRQN